jgi:hypothetical protein
MRSFRTYGSVRRAARKGCADRDCRTCPVFFLLIWKLGSEPIMEWTRPRMADFWYAVLFAFGLYWLLGPMQEPARRSFVGLLIGGFCVAISGFYLIVRTVIAWRIKRIERSAARSIIERNKAIFTTEPYEYRIVDAAQFPELDHDFYNRMRSALEAEGFRFLGDQENVTLSRLVPQMRTFVRTIASADGTTFGGAAHAKFGGAADIESVDLETELNDGLFVITSNRPGSARTPTVPGIDAHYTAEDTPPNELFRIHRERLADLFKSRPHLVAIRVDSMEKVIAAYHRMQQVVVNHMQASGYADAAGLSAASVEKVMGRPLTKLQRDITADIAAEVEKLRQRELQSGTARGDRTSR